MNAKSALVNLRVFATKAVGLFFLITLAATIGGCASNAGNPFGTSAFVPTPYPRDFAIVIDTNNDTYFSRQRIDQVIRASSMSSVTTYTNYSDYNNAVTSRYSTHTPLTRSQLQAMWDAVRRHHLLRGAFTWSYWHSRIDRYQRNSMNLQIRAGGLKKSYYQLNHWDNNKLPLILLCESVDLPIGQDIHPAFPPASMPAATRRVIPVKAAANPALPTVPAIAPATTQKRVLPVSAPASAPSAASEGGSRILLPSTPVSKQ